jgi:hypothetical protein
MKCPHCGAPVQFPPGTQMYMCPYCHQQFATGAAPPPPQATGQGPTFIIIHGPGDDDDDDDDDDHPHHHHHVAAHAVARNMSWITWVVVSIFISVMAGGGAIFAWFSKHSSIASSLVWDGTTPFQCGGNEQINVNGVNAKFNAGTAISVNGNCHFTCTDCSIKSPVVIEAGGNGVVTIVNGSVLASETLVDASGNARVNISGNVVATGEVKKSGNARVSAPKSAAPAPSSAAPTVAAAPSAAPAVKAASKPAASAKKPK